MTSVDEKKVKKIWIDYNVAISEGRMTQEFIESVQDNDLFDIFYACKFPPADVVDEEGYIRLIDFEKLINFDMEFLKSIGFNDIDFYDFICY